MHKFGKHSLRNKISVPLESNVLMKNRKISFFQASSPLIRGQRIMNHKNVIKKTTNTKGDYMRKILIFLYETLPHEDGIIDSQDDSFSRCLSFKVLGKAQTRHPWNSKKSQRIPQLQLHVSGITMTNMLIILEPWRPL